LDNGSRLDTREAHELFSKECFNAAWDLMDKDARSPWEDIQMIHLVHTSLYHWSQRAECTDQNLSIGYWQLSRAYVLIGEPENAIKYGQICLEHSMVHGVAEIFLGYAYETLARASAAAGKEMDKTTFFEKATRIAETLSPENRTQLFGDLETID